MLAMRGVSLSYETVREWRLKFGQTYANGLRHKYPRPGDRWHLDEVFLKINGQVLGPLSLSGALCVTAAFLFSFVSVAFAS
jgi:hypothetical protein